MSNTFKERWVRHAVAVPDLVRTIHRVAKAENWTRAKPVSVMLTYDETVHQHDIYRQKDPDTGKVSPILWWRGAQVGSA